MSLPNALLASLPDDDEPAPSRAALARHREISADLALCGMLRQVEIDWFRDRGVSAFCLAGWDVDPVAMGYAHYELTWKRLRGVGRPPWSDDFFVKRARVQFLPRGYFVLDSDRRADRDAIEPALILPAIEDGLFIDLVAWHPRTGRLASFYRNGCGLLTGPEWDCAEEPIVVHRDPLGWLAACRRGVVVVHEARARPVLLAQGTLQAADVAHGEAIEAMLRKVRLPKIVVPAAAIAQVAA